MPRYQEITWEDEEEFRHSPTTIKLTTERDFGMIFFDVMHRSHMSFCRCICSVYESQSYDSIEFYLE